MVRVVNTDLDGNKPIAHALTKIRGVGKMFANSACLVAGIDRQQKVGEMPDTDVKKIDDIIKNPLKFKIPEYMLNRRKDYLTGTDKHLLTSDLTFTQGQDVRRLQKTKSFRGLRLQAGLPVRGQRTRSNFRRNKGKVMGVKKKSKL